MTTPAVVEVDHLMYLRERRYRRMVLIGLRRLARSRRGLSYLDVTHESDASCCAYEPWPQTARRIYGSLAEDGIGVVHAVLADEEE